MQVVCGLFRKITAALLNSNHICNGDVRHDVLGEVLENRITNYLIAYFRTMTLVFLPSCDNIPTAQNKMRNCRRKYDFHYVIGFRCSCGSCTEAS